MAGDGTIGRVSPRKPLLPQQARNGRGFPPPCGGGSAYNRTFADALAQQRAVACVGVQQRKAICLFHTTTAECVEQRCVAVDPERLSF
jgi:hypothetical protein